MTTLRTANRGYNENDPDYLKRRWGGRWQEHIVPNPDGLDHANAIADIAPEAEHATPPECRGPNSRALKFHIASACSGYATPPTSAELYDAFHTATPTPRSEMLIRMWMNEASENDFFDAWREGCYSWRDIAQACHRHGVLNAKNAPMIRRFAFPKEFTKTGIRQ